MKIVIPTIFCIFCMYAMTGCVKESDSFIKKKLMVILEDDLKSIVNELNQEGISDSAYFEIVAYKKFKSATYNTKAVVDFYIFKKIGVKIVRKYRYHIAAKKWERYFNEYKFYSDTTKE